MNNFDHRSFYRCSEKGLKNSGQNGDSNPDLCAGDSNPDLGAVLHQLRCQANWEQVVMWVDYKPVDVEIDDDISICSSNTWKIPVL